MMKTTWQDWLKTVGIFCVFGPPLGWITTFVVSIAANSSANSIENIHYIFLGLFVGSIFSYFFGLVPALLTGMIIGLLRHRLKSGWYWCLSSVIGFIIAGICVLIFDFSKSDKLNWDVLVTPFNFMGASAAFLCALIARPKHFNPKTTIGDRQ